MKYKAIIIDDEKLARDILKNYLASVNQIDLIAECENGFEGVKATNDFNPDIIFLDIQMPKVNGFEMLELIDNKPQIVFTTAFDEFAIKAFEHNAADYLLKPFSQERFNDAINKVISRLGKNEDNRVSIEKITDEVSSPPNYLNRIVVKKGSQINVIPVDEIVYFEAQDDYVMIYKKNERFIKQKTMKFYEKNLDPKLFVRIHRSYIANIQQINKLELYDKDSHILILKTGEKLKVSKSGYKKLKEVLNF